MNITLFRLRTLTLLILLLAAYGVSPAPAANVPDDASEVQPLAVGAKIPNVTLTDSNGSPFDLTAAVKEKPTVLIFYRGGWCPYCNTQLGELGAIESKLVGLGYQIIAVSPDSPANLKQTEAKGYGHYKLLSDSDIQAAKAFGLAFHVSDALVEKYKGYGIDLEASSGRKHHILPVPAAFMINQKGIIEYRYYNPDYKERVDSEALLESAAEASN